MPEQVAVARRVVEPNVPAGHNEHTDAPASEYVPALHVPEQADTVRPVVEPKVPAGQVVQVLALVIVATVAPARAYLPTAHVTVPLHNGVFNPVVAPYVPAGHNAHVDVFVIVEEIAPATA